MVRPLLSLCCIVVVDTRVLICCSESMYTVVMDDRRGELESAEGLKENKIINLMISKWDYFVNKMKNFK